MPEISARTVIHQNPRHEVYHVRANFCGFAKDYYVSDHGPRVGMVVVRDQSILLVRQYRLLINGFSWEIPGGKIDDGETPEAAAVRECYEETGLHCRQLHTLLSYQAGLDTLNNPTYLFWSNEFSGEVRSTGQPEEVDQCQWVPLARCLDMIFSQEIVCGFTSLALLAYHTRRTCNVG